MIIRTESDANRLLGEYIGTLDGLLFYNLPPDVRDRLRTRLHELRTTEVDIDIPAAQYVKQHQDTLYQILDAIGIEKCKDYFGLKEKHSV